MIADVKIKSIREITNDQGAIQHMIRSDEAEYFRGFGEVYFSFTNPGVIKGWHTHTEQTSLLSCVVGQLQLALIAGQQKMDIRFGPGDRKVVLIPPGVTYGWKNVGAESAILANCATHPHDPATSVKQSLDQLEFPWHAEKDS